MSGFNKWMGIGNLTEDPALRHTNSGTPVLQMRMACNERYKDRDGNWKDRAEYVTCVVWGKRGEALAGILSKGRQVFVEGSLRTSSYEDRDGNKRYKTEVNAQNVVLCGGGGGSRHSGGEEHSEDGYGEAPEDDSLPF